MTNLKKFNLLTLDPMYSPLHNRIANLVALKKYAIVSCLAKRIYLRGFDTYLAVKLIRDISINSNPNIQLLFSEIKDMISYHHAYVRKIERRDLSQIEIRYMIRYYLALEEFILKKSINLVIMHNDQRWYHAIAIKVCQKYNIKYIVTEQGLIRPYTTVLDNQGVNANSTIAKYREGIFNCESEDLPYFKVTSQHDAKIAILFFSIFIIIFLIERLFQSKTIIRYMHNNYKFSKYFRRIKLKYESRIFQRNKQTKAIKKPYVLLLLQLENDSQMLVHSEFSNNQELIDFFQQSFKNRVESIYIKKHPLDTNNYCLNKQSQYILGDIIELAQGSEAVFTVNSSSALSVIKTNSPLFLLGESMFDIDGIGKKINIKQVNRYKSFLKVNRNKRDNFLYYIKNKYLISGAGWCFDDKILETKLIKLVL